MMNKITDFFRRWKKKRNTKTATRGHLNIGKNAYFINSPVVIHQVNQSTQTEPINQQDIHVEVATEVHTGKSEISACSPITGHDLANNSKDQTLRTDSRPVQETCKSNVSYHDRQRFDRDPGYETTRFHSQDQTSESNLISQIPTPLTGSEYGFRDNCIPSVGIHSIMDTSSQVSKQGTESSSENTFTNLSKLTQEDKRSCLSRTEYVPHLRPIVEMEDLDTDPKCRWSLQLPESVIGDQPVPEPVPIAEETKRTFAKNGSDNEQALFPIKMNLDDYQAVTKSITVDRKQSVSIDTVGDVDVSTCRLNGSQRKFSSKSRSAISYNKQPETNETPTISDEGVQFTSLDKSALKNMDEPLCSKVKKDFETAETKLSKEESTSNIKRYENPDGTYNRNKLAKYIHSNTVQTGRVNELHICVCLSDDEGSIDALGVAEQKLRSSVCIVKNMKKCHFEVGIYAQAECTEVEKSVTHEGDKMLKMIRIHMKGTNQASNPGLGVAEQTQNSSVWSISCSYLRDCSVKDAKGEHQTGSTVIDENIIQEDMPKRTSRHDQTLSSSVCIVNDILSKDIPVNEHHTKMTVKDKIVVDEDGGSRRTRRNMDDTNEISNPLFGSVQHNETVYSTLHSNGGHHELYSKLSKKMQSEERQTSDFNENEVVDNNGSQHDRVTRDTTGTTPCNSQETDRDSVIGIDSCKTGDKDGTYDAEKQVESIELSSSSRKGSNMKPLDCNGTISINTLKDRNTEITAGYTIKVLTVHINVKGQDSDTAVFVTNKTLLKNRPVEIGIDEHQTDFKVVDKLTTDEDGMSKRTRRNIDDTDEISNPVFDTVQHTETVCNTLNRNDKEPLHCILADIKHCEDELTSGFSANEVPDTIVKQYDRITHSATGNTQCSTMKTDGDNGRCVTDDKYDIEKQLQSVALTPCRHTCITHLDCNVLLSTSSNKITENATKIPAVEKELENETVVFDTCGQTLIASSCPVNDMYIYMEEERSVEVGLDNQHTEFTVMDNKLTKSSDKNGDDMNKMSSLPSFNLKHAGTANNKLRSNDKDDLGHTSVLSLKCQKKGGKLIYSLLSTDCSVSDNLLESSTRVQCKQKIRKRNKKEPNRHFMFHGMNLHQEKRDCNMGVVNADLSSSIIYDEYDSGIMSSPFLSTLSTYTSLYGNVKEDVTHKSETKSKQHLLQSQIQPEIYEQKLKDIDIAKGIASSWSFFTPGSFIPYVVPVLRGIDLYFQQIQNGQPLTQQSLAYEWIRFQSFLRYTGNGSGIVLARNGFYHDSESGPTATRCYACNARYSDWAYFDNPRERHQPGCQHIQGNSAVNIPIHGDESEDGDYSSVPVHNYEAESSNHNVASASSASNVNDTDTAANGLQSDINIADAYSSADRNGPRTCQTSRENQNAATIDVITSTLENTSTESQPGWAYLLQPTEDRDRFRANYVGRHHNDHNQQTLIDPLPDWTCEDAQVSDRQSSPDLLASQSQSTALQDYTGPQHASSAGQATAASYSTISSQQTASRWQADGARGQGSVVAHDVAEVVLPCETLGHIQTHPELIFIPDPKYPDYTSVDARTDTFRRRPGSLDQTPRRMAEAGFFSTGVADLTTCFACGGRCLNWKAGEDPVKKHTRWYTTCPYVKRLKGESYVEAVKQQHLEEQQRQQQPLDQRRADIKSLREENEMLRSTVTCKVCMDKPVSAIFLPCGHLVCCIDCAQRTTTCPICRKHIRRIVNTFNT